MESVDYDKLADMDMDSACAIIQKTVGQKYGDLASHVMDSEEWESMSKSERIAKLQDYHRLEIKFKEDD